MLNGLTNVGSHAPSLSAAPVHDLEMGVGGETACDMTQGVRATLREDILDDPTAKCLAEVSDLIGSKLAEPAPHVPTREEYRMWAEICVNWARELGRDQRRNCLTLARAYLRAAMSEEAVQPNFSPMLPVVEPSNELVFDCKTRSNGYRTTQDGCQMCSMSPESSSCTQLGVGTNRRNGFLAAHFKLQFSH
jgi:hypothetical protein